MKFTKNFAILVVLLFVLSVVIAGCEESGEGEEGCGSSCCDGCNEEKAEDTEETDLEGSSQPVEPTTVTPPPADTTNPTNNNGSSS